MGYEVICTLDDVWEGEMESFETTDGQNILIIGIEGGGIKAFQAVCPHQEIELVDGIFENNVLTCKAHLWQFDCTTGKGINPEDCHIAEYPIKIDGNNVLVDVTGIKPYTSHV